MMEAWFLADVSALKAYYKKGFNETALPKDINVERIDKVRIESALKEATRHTSKKQYHKTKHAPEILRLIDVGKVRSAAPHCERLFKTLADLIEPPNVAETPASESNPP